MLSHKTLLLAVAYFACSSLALPIRREVPQEHSHEPFLTSVRKSLALNNPDAISDPVFGLLGNAAAAAGQGKITNTDCLQQATADQAFTNAKAANDVDGMVNALLYRAIERNTGKVGLASVACTAITAKNPEIAAVTQHQDPASANAATVNKAITLELAKQIKSVGGDPQLALKAGTFKPGDPTDTTGKGNSCDDANDAAGCIFSQNLIVEDATAAEIDAAVAGTAAGAGTGGNAAASASVSASVVDTASTTAIATATDSATGTVATCPAAATVTVTVSGAAATATDVATATDATATVAATTAAATVTAATTAAASTATTAAASTAGNLQTFTGALGGITAPPVIPGGRGFQVVGNNSDFLNLAAALGRSCDVQHNQCANAANAKASADLTSVSQCETQNTACRAAGGA